jgi:hypothetical protein
LLSPGPGGPWPTALTITIAARTPWYATCI